MKLFLVQVIGVISLCSCRPSSPAPPIYSELIGQPVRIHWSGGGSLEGIVAEGGTLLVAKDEPSGRGYELQRSVVEWARIYAESGFTKSEMREVMTSEIRDARARLQTDSGADEFIEARTSLLQSELDRSATAKLFASLGYQAESPGSLEPENSALEVRLSEWTGLSRQEQVEYFDIAFAERARQVEDEARGRLERAQEMVRRHLSSTVINWELVAALEGVRPDYQGVR
jgi:hypothetical protein